LADEGKAVFHEVISVNGGRNYLKLNEFPRSHAPAWECSGTAPAVLDDALDRVSLTYYYVNE
jgi:hypothetical protein